MKKIFSILACFCVLAVGCIAVACSSSHKHEWEDWEITKNPTCTEQGEKTRKCDDCDKVETEKIDALGHAYEDQSSVATEFEAAKTWKKCSRCGHETEKQDVGTKLTVDLIDEANSTFGLFAEYLYPNVPIELAGSVVDSATTNGYITQIAGTMGGSAEEHNLYTYFYVDLGEHEFTTLKINGKDIVVGTDKTIVSLGNNVFANLETAVVHNDHLYVLAYYLAQNSFADELVRVGLDNKEMNVKIVDASAKLDAEVVAQAGAATVEEGAEDGEWNIVIEDTTKWLCLTFTKNGNDVDVSNVIFVTQKVKDQSAPTYGLTTADGDVLGFYVVGYGAELDFDPFVMEYTVYIPGHGFAFAVLNVSAISE